MVTTRSAAAASPGPSIDALSKSKTITHMNMDHATDMAAILRHFAHLSAAAAASPEMLDMDLTTMTIRSASGTHSIPIVPPMTSWNNRRSRLVDMTMEARKALGLDVEEHGESAAAGAAIPSNKTATKTRTPLTTFTPPKSTDWISFTGVSVYFVCAALVYSGSVAPGSAAWRLLRTIRFPYGPEGFIWLVKAIFIPVVGIHLAEVLWMDRSRLQPGGVQRGSVDWCLWMGSTFLEGLPAYWRWDRVVKHGKEVKRH